MKCRQSRDQGRVYLSATCSMPAQQRRRPKGLGSSSGIATVQRPRTLSPHDSIVELDSDDDVGGGSLKSTVARDPAMWLRLRNRGAAIRWSANAHGTDGKHQRERKGEEETGRFRRRKEGHGISRTSGIATRRARPREPKSPADGSGRERQGLGTNNVAILHVWLNSSPLSAKPSIHRSI